MFADPDEGEPDQATRYVDAARGRVDYLLTCAYLKYNSTDGRGPWVLAFYNYSTPPSFVINPGDDLSKASSPYEEFYPDSKSKRSTATSA